MTPEADKFLRSLLEKDESKIHKWAEKNRRISEVVLNKMRLTDEEEAQAMWLIRNGNPRITVALISEGNSYANGFVPKFIFMDECSNLSEEHLEGIKPVRKYRDEWIRGFATFDNHPKIQISFTELELKHAEWSYLSKKQLYQLLLGAEYEEDFEECALIRDYAKSKGWKLKRES